MNRLQERYVKEIRPELIKKHNYKSTMECPKIAKIVINMGVGDAVAEPKQEITKRFIASQSSMTKILFKAPR